MGRVGILLLSFAIFAGCSHGQCKNPSEPLKSSSTKEVAMTKTQDVEHVKVFKPDGSLQCGQGQKVTIAEMQKELSNIKVYSSANLNDGLMRIQVCGSPTGMNNVYEIDRKDLPVALKAGFKEWTFE